MTTIRWFVSSGSISEFVHAKDQWAAWDTLRDCPAEEFGMIAKAEPNENGEPFLIRTSALMYRWQRDRDAQRFVKRMMQEGMPDTTKADKAAAANSKRRDS